MKTPDNKWSSVKVETMVTLIDNKLNRQEIGELIDALYWKHKIILAGTVKLITQDIEAQDAI